MAKLSPNPVYNSSNQPEEKNTAIIWGFALTAFFAFLMGLLQWLRGLPPNQSRSDEIVQDQDESTYNSDDSRATPISALTQPQKTTQTVDARQIPQRDTKQNLQSQEPVEMRVQPQLSDTRFSPTTKYVVGIGIFLLFLFILFISRNVLSLLIVAALIAFIIQPIISFFQKKFSVSRSVSVGLTYLVVILVLLTIPLFVIPATVSAINFALEIDYSQLLIDITNWLESTANSIKSIPILGNIVGPTLDSILQAAQGMSGVENPDAIEFDASLESIGTRLAQTLGLLVNILGPVVSAVFSFVFMLLISVHLSLSGYKLKEWYPRLIPDAYLQEISQLVNNIEMIWASFLRSQLVLMIVIGITVWLGNWVLGTPQAFFLGLIAGLLEIIPNLGPLIATVPAVLLALFFGSENFAINHWVFALIVIAFYVLIQTLENQVLVPKILGDAVDLPPVVVIIGVVIAGASAGILGVFLATPIIASGREILGYLYDKILEPPVADIEPVKAPSIRETIQNWVRQIKLPRSRKD